MKKAYVKPVFLAEEFVAETSYAATPCGISVGTQLKLIDGKSMCIVENHKNCNHVISVANAPVSGKYQDGFVRDNDALNGYSQNADNSFSYWDYATKDGTDAFLFNSSIADCDFLWSGNNRDNVQVWNSVDKGAADTSKGFVIGFLNTFQSLTGLFCKNEGNGKGHVVGYDGKSFHSA